MPYKDPTKKREYDKLRYIALVNEKRAYRREYYAKNKELEKNRFKKYRAKNIEKLRAYDVVRNSIDPRKRARVLLSLAIKRGDIIRPKLCSKCLKECTPDGHHCDYSKPLDVEWLCKDCHGMKHRL